MEKEHGPLARLLGWSGHWKGLTLFGVSLAFISAALALPDGYDTVLSENGSSLSGGERQRISIARAILKNAPIILLDEATASLDTENESRIQAALSSLLKGRTVLVVAHRLRTVMAADHIVVLKEGRKVEEGTGESLMASQGLFSQMAERQLKSSRWRM